MSHFTEIKTTLKNRSVLIEALQQQGYTVVTGQKHEQVYARGFFGETTPVEFKIEAGNGYDIGFVATEAGDYRLVGDWNLLPQVAGIEHEEFTRKLKRYYARVGILKLAHDKGYSVETVENQETGTVQMVVGKW